MGHIDSRHRERFKNKCVHVRNEGLAQSSEIIILFMLTGARCSYGKSVRSWCDGSSDRSFMVERFKNKRVHVGMEG